METIENIKKQISDLTKSELLELEVLLQPYYVIPQNILNSELNNNSHIYMIKTKDRIAAFFMVNWNEDLTVDKQKLVYLGLSCADQKTERKQLASRVYFNFTREAHTYEKEKGTKLLLYGTTATPLILLSLPKIWDEVKPRLDGSYLPIDERIINELKSVKGFTTFSDTHPFVLKKIKPFSNYSVKEEQRMRIIEENLGINTFKKLNIYEKQGDRLLIVCKVPSLEKIQTLKDKLYSNRDEINTDV